VVFRKDRRVKGVGFMLGSWFGWRGCCKEESDSWAKFSLWLPSL